MPGVGPGGNPDLEPSYEKRAARGPLGTAAARHVIRWNRKALLVEDLLHQVGGGLGECELAEARVDGGEVGVDDLVEGVVLHGASFRTAACLLLLSSSASRGSSLRCFLVSVSSVVFLLCLHYRQESMRTSCRNRHFYCRLIGSS